MCRRFGFVTAIVFASLLPVQAQAAPITLIEGSLPLIFASVATGGVAGPVGNTLALSFLNPNGSTTELNGLPAGGLVTLFFPDLIRGTITGTSVNDSITTYAFLSTVNPVEKAILAPDGTATFVLTATSLEVDSLDPGTLVLRGTETLLGDTSATLDFSPFAPGGFFRFTLSGAHFTTLLADGGSIVISGGSFEQSVAPTAVPEPASMSLLGLGLAGLGARRWRQRRNL